MKNQSNWVDAITHLKSMSLMLFTLKKKKIDKILESY